MTPMMPLWIVRDSADATAASPPVRAALAELEAAVAGHGGSLRVVGALSEVPAGETCIVVAGQGADAARAVLRSAGVTLEAVPEALGLVPGRVEGRPVLLAIGSDARGLAYAVLEIADRLLHADDAARALAIPSPIVERPANPIRSIARLFTSDVEDQGWFHDEMFWRRYLAMLIAQRFNRFSLTLGLGYNFPRRVRDAYFYFAYPFLVAVPGYTVRAVGLPDEKRDRNLAMLRFISDEAAARGLHFQLGLWTHAYEWIDSPEANYTIEGLTPELHAPYCRDALRTLLEACPAIGGVTFRVHGESGVPERSYTFWKTVFDGIVPCGRKVEIDLHAKGLDRELIEVALATGMPVNVSPKYSAEHMGLPYQQASIRELERPPREERSEGFMAISGGARRFLRYSHGDLLTEDRRYGVLYRIWPGTQRLLLWADPAMAAGYGRHAHFCGSLGVELCEPLSFKGRMGSGLPGSRDGYADPSLRPPGGDWQKYGYTYRLFGRLLYNPEAEPETWQCYLRQELGPAAQDAEQALAHASRVLPLLTTAHHPSASNNAYWPEIYTNMPIVDAARAHPYGDTPGPKRFGAVSALDPELFMSVEEFADLLLSGQDSHRYSPADVAVWLDSLCETAERHLAAAERTSAITARKGNGDATALRRLALDVRIQIGLGRFFAAKLRAGVWYALFERTQEADTLNLALETYQAARDAWAEMVRQAEGVYARDLTFGLAPHLRGHWSDRLAAIEADLQDMERRRADARAPETGARRADPSIGRILQGARSGPPAWHCENTTPDRFRPGEPLAVEVRVRLADGRAAPVAIRLHYRHVNQAERYEVAPMDAREERHTAIIPGEYTDSPYPLQYFLEVRDAEGRVWLHPTLGPALSDQPYYVARASSVLPGS